MKRFHAHIAVDDLAKNIEFYSKLFGQLPTVERADSTKHWTIDPSGIAWEHYQTLDDIEHFGADTVSQSGGCCVPTVAAATTGCCVSSNASDVCGNA